MYAIRSYYDAWSINFSLKTKSFSISPKTSGPDTIPHNKNPVIKGMLIFATLLPNCLDATHMIKKLNKLIIKAEDVKIFSPNKQITY